MDNYEIVSLLRVEPQIKHKQTGQIVTLPICHFLIEKIDSDSYGATCLEYAQSAVAENNTDVVIELYETMVDYFLAMIKRYGKESIYEIAESPQTEELWGKVRKYQACQYENDLIYVEMNLRNENPEKMKEQSHLLKVNSENRVEYIEKDKHDKEIKKRDERILYQEQLINSILAKYQKLQEQKQKESKGKHNFEHSSMIWFSQITNDTLAPAHVGRC